MTSIPWNVALSLWLVSSFTALAISEPMVPSDGSLVLSKSRHRRSGLNEPAPEPAQAAWLNWKRNPSSQPAAIRCIREQLQSFRRDGNPRHLGLAGACLRGMEGQIGTSPELLRLRGTVRQSLHEFDAAVQDLEAALKLDPANGEAWLTLSIVLQVQGRYEQARKVQWQVLRSCPGLLAATSAAQLASLTGQPDQALRLLEPWLTVDGSPPSTQPDQLLWALTVAAEIAGRSGQIDQADRWFARAAGIDPQNPYLLAAWSDFLLMTGRAPEVLKRLESKLDNEALALRWLIASVNMGERAAEVERRGVIDGLNRRWDLSLLRGEDVHLRERAAFELFILRQPAPALDHALRNWRVQKEPADLELLLHAAVAAQNAQAASLGLEWMTRHHQEYPAWFQLVNQARQVATGSLTGRAP